MRSLVAALALVGAWTLVHGAEIPFGSPTTISSSVNDVRQIVTADLDRDGDLDVACVSRLDDRLSWFEAVGGSFTERVVSTSLDGAVSVAAGDVDSDGRIDLVAAASGTGEIFWYCNDGGAPTFFTPHLVDAVAGIAFVGVADLDRDGDLDLMTAAPSGARWYENAGGSSPSFTMHPLTTVDSATLVVADLDRDGDPDVVSAEPGSDRVAWYANDGGGLPGFALSGSVGGLDDPRSLAAVDLDRDGDPDLLVASTEDDTIAWIENDGASSPALTLRTISTAAGGPAAITASDLDRDGDPDLLVASSTGNRFAWFENDGVLPFSFTERLLESTALGARSVVSADVDGDGDRDVVRASSIDDTVGWIENETIHRSAAFLQRRLLPSTGEDWWGGVGDIDRDGDVDLLLPSDGSPALSWYARDPSAPDGYVPHVIDDLPLISKTIATDLADIDGDGDLDVWLTAWWIDEQDQPVGVSAWYENAEGDGSSWTNHPLDLGPAQRPVGGDLDRDGDQDVVLGQRISWNDWNLIWLENDGGASPQFTTRVAVTPWLYPDDIRLDDMDGDGDLDILTLSLELDGSWEGLAWYENDGASPPAFTPHPIALGPVTSVFSADLDGDGDQDAVSASYHFGKLAWYENNSASPPAFIEHVIFSAISEPDADLPGTVYVSDADGDGDLDLVVGTFYDGPIYLYENDGASPPSFGSGRIIGEADAPLPVRTADLDGDGDEDLLATSAVSYERPSAWYPNRGGQLGLSTTPQDDLFTVGGATIELQPLVATHTGRAGDGDAELVRIELLFEEDTGDPLSSSEVDALIETLSIYRDDGSGQLETASDPLVAQPDPSTLIDGILGVEFADGDPNARIVHGAPVTYFLTAELTAAAASRSPNRFRLTHRTEEGGVAEDRDRDLPLELQATPILPSGHYTAAPGAAGSVSGLRLDKVTVGLGGVHLFWDGGCLPSDIDYAVYRGIMPEFTQHASVVCTTAGATDQIISPDPAADFYYLVVPSDGLTEGSYGLGQGVERPAGISPCRTRSIATCPAD